MPIGNETFKVFPESC